jgi:hypothetical protein
MKRLRLLLASSAVALLALGAASALADPNQGPPICNGPETAISGNYGNLVIVGNRYVPAGQTLNVHGDLTLFRGSCLDAFTLGTVHVWGNVSVGWAGILALGCTPGSIGPGPPCNGQTTNDIVGGSIVAIGALTMYLDGNTIGGSIVSIGGGPGVTFSPYINFPIKDNTIGGNVEITGWRGTWWGFIRNVTHGSVTLIGNSGADPDSSEVATNTISGNLTCLGNSPGAQFGDSGGLPNNVGGLKIGECRGL